MEISPEKLSAVVERFKEDRTRIADAWHETHDTEACLNAHSAALDRAVLALGSLAEFPSDGLALAAVGGYGRRELFPHSDIDLLVLLSDDRGEDEETKAKISAFLAALWELGLTVGATVRTEKEFTAEAAEDVSIATTYLESRFLWGERTLYDASRDDFFASLDARAFFRDKMLELRRRHQKYEDTPYALEPNLKESPVRLRELERLAGFGYGH